MSKPSIRLCVFGDFEGPHTRRWVKMFAGRDDFDLHLVSYFPAPPVDGATMHALVGRVGGGDSERSGPAPDIVPELVRTVRKGIPRSLLHLLNAARYRVAGLARTFREIQPDLLHSHFLVEHSFFAATAGFRPHIVTAWGSDVMVMAARSPVEREIVKYTLRHADLAVTNNPYLSTCTRALAPGRLTVETITLGIDRSFLKGFEESVNVREHGGAPTIISTRSLDSGMYGVGLVIRAFALVRGSLPEARLFIAGAGRLRPVLERLASSLGLSDAVTFLGFVPHEQLIGYLAQSHVYVSVPRSDATALSTLEAMACGCFPVVSDLASQDGLIMHGENGLRTPLDDARRLADNLLEALSNNDLRRRAAVQNRSLVERKGLLEPNMQVLEEWYRRLANR